MINAYIAGENQVVAALVHEEKLPASVEDPATIQSNQTSINNMQCFWVWELFNK